MNCTIYTCSKHKGVYQLRRSNLAHLFSDMQEAGFLMMQLICEELWLRARHHGMILSLKLTQFSAKCVVINGGNLGL